MKTPFRLEGPSILCLASRSFAIAKLTRLSSPFHCARRYVYLGRCYISIDLSAARLAAISRSAALADAGPVKDVLMDGFAAPIAGPRFIISRSFAIYDMFRQGRPMRFRAASRFIARDAAACFDDDVDDWRCDDYRSAFRSHRQKTLRPRISPRDRPPADIYRFQAATG